MAPQTSTPVAATVLGTIGTILWCVQLVPQIWTNWRSRSTDGLPGTMMFLWALCGVPLGTYSVVQRFNVPIQVQPHVFAALCLVSWSQTLAYSRGWRARAAGALAAAVAAALAGAEVALILTIRPVYDRGDGAPVLVVGVVAAVLLAAGLLAPYGEIWKRRGRVIGINWVFLTIDCSGAFFSLMAIVAQTEFDVLGGVLYTICMALEIGIFTSHVIWRLRTRSIRKEARARGKTFDDVAAEHEERGIPFRFAERKGRKERRERKKQEKEDVEAGVAGVCQAGQPAPAPARAGPAGDDGTSPEERGDEHSSGGGEGG